MPEICNVIFNGETVPGSDEQKVKQTAAKVFHASPEQLATLFSGKTVILKTGLTEEDASTFTQKLKGIGLICRVQPQNAPEEKTQAEPKQPTTPTKTETSQAAWDIAPAGADVNALKSTATPLNPDTSQLELRPQKGYLIEPDNNPEPKAPDTSHITLE